VQQDTDDKSLAATTALIGAITTDGGDPD